MRTTTERICPECLQRTSDWRGHMKAQHTYFWWKYYADYEDLHEEEIPHNELETR